MKRVLLMLNMSEKSSRDRLSGFLRYTLRTNWAVTVFEISRNYSTVAACSRALGKWKPDGVVYLPNEMTVQVLRKLPPQDAPFLIGLEFGGDGLKPDGLVRIDNAAVVRAAVQTLARRGLGNFGFFSGYEPSDDFHVAARARAFHRIVREAGGTASAYMTKRKTRAPDIRAIARWLGGLPKPCGIVLYNDSCALPAYAAYRQLGPIPSNQIHFIGVDNDPMFCENLNPPLSSVEPDFERSGFLAARQLDECFARGRPGVRTLDYGVLNVVERASTMDTSNATLYVYRAREYLQHHADGRLSVVQVAEALNLSPRLLERHFAETTGHTLRQEMLDLRFDRLRRLLTTTNRSIGEIVDLCGWSSVSSAKRIFHERYGLTMRDYREQSRVD